MTNGKDLEIKIQKNEAFCNGTDIVEDSPHLVRSRVIEKLSHFDRMYQC